MQTFNGSKVLRPVGTKSKEVIVTTTVVNAWHETIVVLAKVREVGELSQIYRDGISC